MLQSAEKTNLINSFARTYEKRCEATIGHDLEALYLFGSHAFDKLNLNMPDINYFLLLKEGVDPSVFLTHADMLRDLINEYKGKARILVEFRPNRYIYSSEKDVGFDFVINPQYGRMEDRHGDVPFGWGWVFEAFLRTRKIVFGHDALVDVHQPVLTIDYIKKYFPATFSHIWLPLERAPIQFHLPEDNYLLLHEALKVAQNAAIGFGVNLALNEAELKEKKWLEFVYDKNKLIPFYKDRYDEKTAQNVVLLLEVRDNWDKYKNDVVMGQKMYRAAVSICTSLKAKYIDIVSGRTGV